MTNDNWSLLMSYAEIWKKLSAIDVSDHTESKNGLTYLSWAWAWGVMMEHYPDAQYHFTVHTYPDQTAEVHCVLNIGNCVRTMDLPVLDYRNKPIPNPNAFNFNTTKMRCLVKCMAMFGLGHYIYAGEDLPHVVKKEMSEAIEESERLELMQKLEETGSDMDKFLKAFNVKALPELTKAQYKKAMQLLEKKSANS